MQRVGRTPKRQWTLSAALVAAGLAALAGCSVIDSSPAEEDGGTLQRNLKQYEVPVNTDAALAPRPRRGDN